MPRLLIKRILVITLAGVVILAGLLVGGVRLIDHFVPAYRNALAERIGNRIDADIEIGAIELRWRWRGPVLQLRDVSVTRHGQQQPAVVAEHLGLEFGYRALIAGRRLPEGLAIDSPKLAVRLDDNGRPRLVHWSRPGDPPLDWDAVAQLRDVLSRARIDDADIDVRSPRLPGGRAHLNPASLSWRDRDGRLRWQAAATGPDWFGDARTSGEFTGRLPDPQRGRLHLTVDGLGLAALARADERLDERLTSRLRGGRLTARIDLRLADGDIRRGDARLALTAVDDTKDDRPLLPALKANIEAVGPSADQPTSERVEGLRFVVRDLQGELPGLAQTRISGRIDPDRSALRMDVRHPPVEAVFARARRLFPRLADTHLSAEVDNLHLVAARARPLQLGFDFAGLTIDDARVSAGPVDGTYYQRDGHHELALHNGHGPLAVARYLRGELAVDDFDGALSWHRDDEDRWRIDARRLALTTGEASVEAAGSVILPATGAPIVDITGHASAPDVVRLLKRIPQADDLPNDRLRDWLGKAITAGRLTSADLAVSGSLERFPFAQPAEGERFHLALAGDGVDVDYKPGWPALEDARGTLTLDGDDLRVDVAEARMLDTAIGPATGRIANVREPVLMLDGGARRAPADRMLSFLVASPLRDKFARLVEAVKITGPADLALDLRIPLKPGLGEVDVKGQITAHGNTLRQAVLPGPIEDITGRLSFDGRGLNASGLKGRLLGVELNTHIQALANGRQRIVSEGTISLPDDAEALAHYLPRPWLRYGRGRTRARVAFDIARSGELSPVVMTSDLTGLALSLPDPLTKPAATPAPLKITVAPDARRIDVDYDQRLDVDLRLADGQPQRIQARVGDRAVTPPDVDGIWIGGHARSLDGIGWFNVVRTQLDEADAAAGATGSTSSLAFIGGDLTTDRLTLDNRYFESVQVRAQPTSAAPGWRVDFEGPNTQGQIIWAQPAHGRVGISGSLARLALKTRAPDAAPPVVDDSTVIWQGVSPDELPRLDIRVAQVVVDDTDFGHADIQASALPGGWQLDGFELSDGALTGRTTGRWLVDNGLTRANAETRLQGHGLARLMRTLGYVPTLRARTADVHARLAIAPNRAGLDLRALDGEVSLALDDGTLLSVEPGAARVLGLMNLYVLPRRLRLDFRDVVDEGMAFDSIRARFDLAHGNAYSDGVTIETPSSKIRMSGRIGLAARDYDERVTIMPKLGSGVAIASGVIGGPLVGAAVFAFQELFKKPIQKFSSIAYTLKGSWDDPTISEPSAEPSPEP
ncbi:DUF3971 domain-containing protein [Salinisphaera sp. T31B1]|uniref:YhdP family phospholipid transporter n=1 Tax=Salinisphaera sp. T31B1 TaxID=727963 RepID=UPI00333FDBDE